MTRFWGSEWWTIFKVLLLGFVISCLCAIVLNVNICVLLYIH